MRVLGWMFFGLAIVSIHGGNEANAQYFTRLGCMHVIGANIIHAINKGDR